MTARRQADQTSAGFAAGALPRLDRIDIRILAHLQQNGRVTNVDLAEAVGLSASPCLMRVRRLEKARYIAGYGAHIQIEKLGPTLLVFTEVTLSDHRVPDFARFEAAVRKVDEIVECHLVSGGYDYLLKFVTLSIQHYQETIEGLLGLGIGIEKYFSYVVIKSIFVKPFYPIEKFFGADG
jgi:DNA-binding Lrp family transcriptional regulator